MNEKMTFTKLPLKGSDGPVILISSILNMRERANRFRGSLVRNGNYPLDAINFTVNERLKTLAISFKEASEEKNEDQTKDK